MIHYKQNTALVIEALNKCRYEPSTLRLTQRCFAQFKKYMDKMGINIFSSETAQGWCEQEAPISGKRHFSYALHQLVNAYEYGHVLSSHLTIHGKLSDSFTEAINTYLDSLSSADFIDSSLSRFKDACSLLCRFCQINGIYSIEEIRYPVLEQYHQFLLESNGSYNYYEGYAGRMLMFWAERGRSRFGYSLFLHYAKFKKDTCVKDLSFESRAIVENLRERSHCFSSDKFFRTIVDFIDKLAVFGYSKNLLHAASYYLNVLCLFLEREELGYDWAIADMWIKDVCARIFGKSKVKNVRRTLDLYDDFITTGDINPAFKQRQRPSTYVDLPEWCKSELEIYRATRKKEGINQHTIAKQHYSCAKFCKYIASEGMLSFEELVPEHIKRFNIQDKHETSGGKNSTNHAVNQFLIHLELRNVIRPGLHSALSCCTAKEEHIIKVLSDEDRACIDLYCSQAASPIELRDAAILRLGMNTALRGCDIVSLKLADIDWKSRCIRFVQSKTVVGHVHPVNICTLNAIFRYLCDGRSKYANTDYVFISMIIPFDSVLPGVCRDALVRAGSSATGFHCLRRSYATDVMKAGATFAETAELLGHSDTGTVHKYALLDEEKMRICSLSLEQTGLAMDGRYDCAE